MDIQNRLPAQDLIGGEATQAALISAAVQPNQAHTAGGHTAGAGRYALRVLVVDDELDAALTLMAILREDGYETRGAHRGLEALEAMRDFAPHAVLLDIGMPDLNGYDVARKIRERYAKHGPLLIAVTARKQHEDKVRARQAGFDHHVAKPYDPEALLDLLKPLRTYGGPKS
ncbi:MAG TPA: response regulator [Burkholderiales bacterium]|nr:response regulator [Burkholderiales bacterium]